MSITQDQKGKLYTLRWLAMEINKKSTDLKVDELAVEQVKLLTELIGDDLPKEYQQPEPDRPSVSNPAPPKGGVIYLPKRDLWYPKAIIRTDLKMKSNGNYPKGYPMGLIVHYTAGNFDKGVDNAIATIKGGISNGYKYECLGRDGKLVQTNPLSQWGSHAGESAWVINGVKKTSVSQYFAGLEICNAGILTKKGTKYYTYWGKEIPASEVRYVAKNDDNIAAGYYHKYSTEQETELLEYCLWLKANNPDVFSFDYILGHDEVAGPKGISRWRKTDPGGALSMNMSEFRNKVKLEYKKRYG
ncbi:MAG: N-acetylmuramoyl-L-alanine amidase [Pseudobdellovibrio sp.]